MLRPLSTLFFFVGTFITSFGNVLFLMSIPAFFVRNGFSTEIIGFTIGMHRISGIIASSVFGPNIDRFNSRKVILVTEFFAALSSVGLILSWIYRDHFGLTLFWLFLAARAFIIGVQSTSRNRLIKLISNENNNLEASSVIWLNKATHGAHIISSLVAIPVLASGNFLVAIIIDGLSFLIGGYSVLALPKLDESNKEHLPRVSLLGSVTNLIKMHPRIFILDQLLALVVTGTIVLVVKLSSGNATYILYFNLIYGCTVWLSSLVAHNLNMRNYSSPYWLLMLIGFIFLSFNFDTSWRFVHFFMIFMGYWILYHKYTAELQVNTHKDSVGSVMAARILLMLLTLSLGEFLGGYIGRVIDISTELIARGGLCVLVLVFLSYSNKKLIKAKV